MRKSARIGVFSKNAKLSNETYKKDHRLRLISQISQTENSTQHPERSRRTNIADYFREVNTINLVFENKRRAVLS